MAADNDFRHLHLASAAADKCSGCAIRHSSLCGALTNEEITDLNMIAARKQFSVGQSYYFQGDVIHSFANVTQGMAKLVRTSEDGRSQIVGLLFPSDFLGSSIGTQEDAPASHGVEAVSDLELCVFPRIKFEPLLQKHPALELKLLNRTLSELQIAREWMVLLGRKTAEERVATFLLYVAEKMTNVSCQGQSGFDLPLNRADIGDYVGLTLETVSRQISRLRKDGIIEMTGSKHVAFVDVERLKARANF